MSMPPIWPSSCSADVKLDRPTHSVSPLLKPQVVAPGTSRYTVTTNSLKGLLLANANAHKVMYIVQADGIGMTAHSIMYDLGYRI